MAMTAWSANVSSSAICCVRERADLRAGAPSARRSARRSRRSGTHDDRCRYPMRPDARASRDSRPRRPRRSSATWIVRPSRSAPAGRSDRGRGMLAEVGAELSRLLSIARTSRTSADGRADRRSRECAGSTAAASQSERRVERWRQHALRSVGDEAMTRRTSAVAVCCSSASVTWRLLS